ncbi:response regulator transcription factor [Mucilaginibacter pineti]|nr:LuxR C-terminal-related transcriptional regulator [Mucilaginibacter pineti]
MIAYGMSFLMGSYFPFYFYKEFDLKALRKHVIYGVPSFLIMPYLLFFVILYMLNGDLRKDIRYGVIVPFAYSLVLLWVILSAIRKRYQCNRDDHFYTEEIMVYCAVLPWVMITVLARFEVGQLAQTLCANVGFLIITTIFFFKSARRAMLEYLQENAITIGGTTPYLFQANCLHFDLTRTEILIIQYIYKGLSNKEIADVMAISENTVKKHIQNAYRKTNVKSRSALIYKLQNHRN